MYLNILKLLTLYKRTEEKNNAALAKCLKHFRKKTMNTRLMYFRHVVLVHDKSGELAS